MNHYINQTLNYINLQFYYSEQYINQIIINNLSHTTLLIFILLFISGILTSINPCNISILAVTTPYINLADKQSHRKHFVTLGIISSFIIITLLTVLLSQYFQLINNNLPIISSIYIIILGLNLLDIIQLNLTSINTNNVHTWSINSIITDYITGVLIGFSASSCSTPIIATIMFWISQSQSIFLGMLYISLYLLGYTLPLIILTNRIINYSIKIGNIWKYAVPISGSIMLGFGTLSLFNNIFT